MKAPNLTNLPTLTADLLLVHPPAYFDFRSCREVYFPFLSTSGAVPITPLYEYFPIGFKSLQRYLSDRSYEVKIINLATLLLRYPTLDFESFLNALQVGLLGIDLHWMVHVQGSLAIAQKIKEIRKDIPIIFGGISATYYADELIRYPFVDMVMRGYDTHQPLALLLESLRVGRQPAGVPNLVWKSADGRIKDNGYSYKPATYGCAIDWSKQPNQDDMHSFPIFEVVSTTNVGCQFNCGWCGGSRDAFKRIHGLDYSLVPKPMEEIEQELGTLNSLANINQYHFYPVNSYNEPKNRMNPFIELVAASNLKSISYEQYLLTPEDILRKMAHANRRTTITLSPESHDIKVSKLAGRGAYTNKELEAWIERALEIGIYQIDIWYFIGMPEQDEASVQGTVEYAQRLLEKFKHARVNPMICPMIPFLDPGSNFFEEPEKHGYRVFYRTAEEHRRAMGKASIINQINYETRWLKRSDLVRVGFQAVKHLMEAKASTGFLPDPTVKKYVSLIEDALDFISVVHEVDNIPDLRTRAAELERLGTEIQQRNDRIFFSGVSNQAFPVNRQIGGRWFDELGWDVQVLDAHQAASMV